MSSVKQLNITVKKNQVFNATITFFDDNGEPINFIGQSPTLYIYEKVLCNDGCDNDASFEYQEIEQLMPSITGDDNNKLQFDDDILLETGIYKYNLFIDGQQYLTGQFEVKKSRTYISWQSSTQASISGNASYVAYSALLSQAGTSAPVADVVFENGIGNIVWSRDSIGLYTATLNGAFTVDKTSVPPFGSYSGDNTNGMVITDFAGAVLGYYTLYPLGDGNKVNLFIVSAVGESIDLGQLIGAVGTIFIEIRVYS